MIVGGFQKFSLIDYPGKVCAVIFTRGCNLRCKYCHNPELVVPDRYSEEIPFSDIYSFLETRVGKLDAVVFTGGEPTEQADLLEVIANVADMGFLIKLDTNGTNPDVLEELFRNKLIDYIAMDIKAPIDDCFKVTGVDLDSEILKRSIELIVNSRVDHEFRTTVARGLIDKEDIIAMAETLKNARKYCLQRALPSKSIDPDFLEVEPYSEEELTYLISRIDTDLANIEIR